MTDNSMVVFGDRTSVKDIKDRLILAMPGGRRIEQNEALALAQVAVAHKLDPFNGEVWYIPGSGIMIGIKGLRKEAGRQLRREADAAGVKSANYWTEFNRETDYEAYQAGPNDIIVRCELRDPVTIEAWTASVEGMMKRLGIKFEEASRAAGKMPVTVGIGIYKAGEKSRMQPAECAHKRAEANAIKQRFNVEFATVNVDEGPDIVDGEFSEAPDAEPAADPGPEPQSAVEDEDQSPPVEPEEAINEWNDGAIQAVIKLTEYSEESEAAILLGKSTLDPQKASVTAIEQWCRAYQAERDTDIPHSAAVAWANEHWNDRVSD